MIIIHMCLAVIFFIAVSYITGLFFRRFWMDKSVLFSVLCGFLLMLALFEVISLPFILLKMSFKIVCVIYFLLLFILDILSLVLNIKIIKSDYSRVRNPHQFSAWYIPAALLIALQIYCSVFYMHIDDDDAFYVASAVTAVQTDTMYQFNAYTGEPVEELPSRYVLSPFPIFTAALAQVTGIHPTILSHTVFPGIFILYCYAVFIIFARMFFSDSKKRKGLFLLWICLINIFGYYSVYTSSTFMLIRLWQGKALLAALILPLTLYLYMIGRHEKLNIRKMFLFWIVSLAGSLTSSMGIILIPLVIGGCSLTNSIMKKKPKELIDSVLLSFPCIALGVFYIVIK